MSSEVFPVEIGNAIVQSNGILHTIPVTSVAKRWVQTGAGAEKGC